MQDKMMEIVKQIKQLIVRVPDASANGIIRNLQTVCVQLEDLTVEFPELRTYELTVSGVDVPDDIRVIQTVLPVMFADLALSGKNKPARERTVREKAMLALLPIAVEEIYEPILVSMPRLTARNIDIRLATD